MQFHCQIFQEGHLVLRLALTPLGTLGRSPLHSFQFPDVYIL